MNLYFLVEGRRTEKAVYPQWLKFLLPELNEVTDPFKIKSKNSFYVFSGNGYPSLLHNHLKNAISDINKINKFDFLVICLDADDQRINDREREVTDYIAKNSLSLLNTELIVIVQNRCIETWFLGNKKVATRNPQSQQLRTYYKFYDVKVSDPELCGIYKGFSKHTHFHESYLKEILKEKGLTYSKSNPNEVCKPYFIEELYKRTSQTGHLISLKRFFDFIIDVKTTIEFYKLFKIQ